MWVFLFRNNAAFVALLWDPATDEEGLPMSCPRPRLPSLAASIVSMSTLSLACEPGVPLDPFAAGDPQRAAVDYVRANAGAMGVQRPEEMRPIGQFLDQRGDLHLRLQQTLGQIPVWGGDLIVQLSADGRVIDAVPPRVPDTGLVDGELVRPDRENPFGVGLVPALDADAAIARAEANYGCGTCLTAPSRADLWVLRHGGTLHLTWRVRMTREDGSTETALPVRFVDAHDGAVLWGYDNLQTLDGTGQSLYSGTVPVQTSSVTSGGNTTFFLEDLGRRSGTYDFHDRTAESAVTPMTDADNEWIAARQQAAVDAHFGAARVLDYYQSVHGRNGIDGAGGPGFYTASADNQLELISSRVHYGNRYNNAFWNGSTMTYGDGDGVELLPLVTLDITGHEMTHGVTERSANLAFSNQGGALNESWSDVFGAMVERSVKGEGDSTWLVGEECFTPEVPGDAVRSLADPHTAPDAGFTPDDDPDHYKERYTGLADNGGVHINSGIPNKVFYLLAKGGTHHRGGSMTGIGAEEAARIWYRALTAKMTSSTNFATARLATLAAAADLFGGESAQAAAVSQAWCLVGVGSCLDYGHIANGSFEGVEAPWQRSGSAAVYSNDGNYPNVGTGYMYIGGTFSTSGSFGQTLAIPASAASAILSFGLNVTSNENSSNPQDVMRVEITDASNRVLQLLAIFSSLDKGAAGAYVTRTGYDLAAYKGQSVRLRFRATKAFFRSTTFRIDDVSIK
jgi:thermolysin